jgi:hypothetical protein
MANTFTLIQVQTLSSNQTTVTFTSIPQTYTDLQLVYSVRNTTGANYAGNAYLTFNGATSRYYEMLFYNASGEIGAVGKANVDPYLQWPVLSQGAGTSIFSSGQFYIANYTSTNPKSGLSDWVSEDTVTPWMTFNASYWDPTSNVAITSMSFTSHLNQFAQYSSFYLYGIKNS